jgi:hypothetical protein
MKNKCKYFITTLIICFIISACNKDNGPFPDVYLITNFRVTDNCSDTNCIKKWSQFKIYPCFNGILALENVDFINVFYVNCYYFKNIKIYTINYYNNKYPANSDVTELFNVASVSVGVGYIYNDYGSISSLNNLIYDNYFFIFNEPPEYHSEQRFIVEIDNGAGEIFRDTTRSVYLTIE